MRAARSAIGPASTRQIAASNRSNAPTLADGAMARPIAPPLHVSTLQNPNRFVVNDGDDLTMPSMNNRVVLIGAVHEASAALGELAEHQEVDLVGFVTLTAEAGVRVSGFVDLTAEAKAAGATVIRTSDVNDPETVAALRSLAPDLIAVVGWTRLIGEELLRLPRAGCVGFHASLLPHGRGRAPVNWSIIRGEPRTGNTMMLLDAGVDTGVVIDQRSTPIYIEDTCHTVYERVARLGGDMLRDNVTPLLKGAVRHRQQDDARVTIFPKRVPEMGVTDWQRSPGEIHDWVRAQTQPYPGAFTWFRGTRVRLWASEVPKSDEARGEPGEILSVDPDGLRVATGDNGSILITAAGLDDGPVRSPIDVVEPTGLSVGARFEVPDRDVAAWALGAGPRPAGAP